VDVFSEPIPIAPAAHYWMGGIATDTNCQTSIPGLYAIGETASTGVHGANRLASNSLLECLVFAAQLTNLQEQKPESLSEKILLQVEQSNTVREFEQLKIIREHLPKLVWQSAGICREDDVLRLAIAQVSDWQTQMQGMKITQLTQTDFETIAVFTDPAAESQIRLYAETRNLVDVAALILKSAAWRTESRGGHYRTDYCETLSEWQAHTLIEGEKFTKSPLID
jgi:L-aspartate oxidase